MLRIDVLHFKLRLCIFWRITDSRGKRQTLGDIDVGKRKQQTSPAVELAEDGFIPVIEAARFLGLSRAKVYQMMDSGELRYAKFGRSRRIPRRALMELAERSIR
jgi:excisionase family DNA binding protein